MKSCHLHTDFLVILQCNKFKKKTVCLTANVFLVVFSSRRLADVHFCIQAGSMTNVSLLTPSTGCISVAVVKQKDMVLPLHAGFQQYSVNSRISCLISSPGLALERSEIFSVKLRQCWVLPQVIKCLSLSTIIQTFTYTSDQSGIARHSSQLCEQKQ